MNARTRNRSHWRLSATGALALLLGGCAAAIPPPPVQQGSGNRPISGTAPRPGVRVVPPSRPEPMPQVGFRAPQIMRVPGLQNVIEQNADTLVRRFGPARLDVREGDMRKLQFSGQACVLDVFLYPLREGAEPVATYVEARRGSDGQDVDRAACVTALQRR